MGQGEKQGAGQALMTEWISCSSRVLWSVVQGEEGVVIQGEEQKDGCHTLGVSAGLTITICLSKAQRHRVSPAAGYWGSVKARPLS